MEPATSEPAPVADEQTASPSKPTSEEQPDKENGKECNETVHKEEGVSDQVAVLNKRQEGSQDDELGEKAIDRKQSDEADQELSGDLNNLVEDEDIEDGDPIPSGTGVVSRDCSASELVGWSDILPKWRSQRPRGLAGLVRNGIPEPLRGEVWQLLAGTQQCSNLMEKYRIFLTKSAPAEQTILRDVHRTYPAHENFRQGSGSSSLIDSLFKVCKAYAVYDEEVGYCQGLSFLVAALLLHMPEEQAFCVFVRIMQHYGLRDLFRNNFDELYLKFYQLEKLLEEHLPALHQHFNTIGIEPFTYASQWFLTVFTAKFPLNAVFYIMDVFLLDGMNTIFQVALALLEASKDDLLARDFEGVLKYFRVQMPKRYRDQENVQQLIKMSAKFSVKKLSKHAKAYEAMKQKEKLLENPLTRLRRENTKLTENNLRLEQENDDLARDLVASKIQLRAQLDLLEDKIDTLEKALTYSRQDCQSYRTTISDMEDERNRLEVEVSQLKEVCRRELHRAESEQIRDSSIIADYKKICSQLSKRLDYRLELTQQFIETIKDHLRDNESCSDRKCFEVFCSESDEFVEKLKSDANMNTSTTSSTPSQGNSPLAKNSSSPRRKEVRQASVESDPTNRPVGALLKSSIDSQTTSSEHKINQLTKHVDELEVELARTKLALVEAECRCQQLAHDMSLGASVTTTMNSAKDQVNSQTSGLLANKLVSMKAAISPTNRAFGSSKSSAGSTFAKLNNIISEKISTISQVSPPGQAANLPNSTSTPLISSFIPSNSSEKAVMGAAVVAPNASRALASTDASAGLAQNLAGTGHKDWPRAKIIGDNNSDRDQQC